MVSWVTHCYCLLRLRWCYQDGTVLLTGDERAEQERQRAEQAEQRTQLLADRLRAMGVDPDTL